MKLNPLSSTCAVMLACATLPAHAAVLFVDNFNAPDNNNFDQSMVPGRVSGELADSVELKSARTLQAIQNNQLRMARTTDGSGRLRFHETGSPNRFNFASGATATAITSAGGVRIEFDFIPTDITGTNWVSFNAGILDSNPPNSEPQTRVNHIDTDFAILFRNNGGTERFDNGAGQTTGSFTPDLLGRHVVIELLFTSFDDNTSVNAISSVDGVEVDNYTFNWQGNTPEGGVPVIQFELESNVNGTRLDNLSISTIPEPGVAVLGALGLFGFALRRQRR